MRGILSIVVLMFTVSMSLIGQPQPVFRLAEKDLIPEGIAYSAEEKCFYVGSIHKRKIVRIQPDGKVADFVTARQHDLAEVLGMKVDEKRKLLIALSNEGESNPNGKAWVHIFRLDGSLLKKFDLPAAGEIHLFNDLVIGAQGDLYITDSDGQAIYRVDERFDSLKLWVKSADLRFANGITLSPDQKNLIVSTARGLTKIDLETKTITPLPFENYYIIGVDGLYTAGHSLIAVQNVTYPISIVQYFLSADASAIVQAKGLVVDDPGFVLPTTGAIANGWFYYIANTHLHSYKDGKLVQPEKLKEIVISRIKL